MAADLAATIADLRQAAARLERDLVDGRLNLARITGQITAFQAILDGAVVVGDGSPEP